MTRAGPGALIRATSSERSTGLSRWWSKPAARDALAVVGLAPAGQRDQQHAVHAAGPRAAGARPRSRPCPACRCRGSPTSGRSLRRRVERLVAARRRPAVRRPAAPSSARQRVGRVAVVVDDQDALASAMSPARGARRRPAAHRRGVGAAAARRSNSLPRPGPSLVALTRAAVQLDQALDQRQADAEAALRGAARVPLDLHEHVEDRGEHVAGGCRRRCRATRTTRRRAVALDDARRCGPPAGVYLAALFSRLENTCVSRTASPSAPQRAVRTGATRSAWPPASISGAAEFDRVARSPASSADRLELQFDLAARDARHLQQVVDQPHHVVDLPLHHLAAGLRFLRRRCSCACSDGQRGAHRRQRVAQLVRQRGEEFGLALVGLAAGPRACRAARTGAGARAARCARALTSAATRIGRSSTVTLASTSIASAMARESAPCRARISTGRSDHGGCAAQLRASRSGRAGSASTSSASSSAPAPRSQLVAPARHVVRRHAATMPALLEHRPRPARRPSAVAVRSSTRRSRVGSLRMTARHRVRRAAPSVHAAPARR